MLFDRSRAVRRSSTRAAVLSMTSLLAACSGVDSAPLPPCAEGQERFRGQCVDPAARYEPTERIDQDNTVAYGDSPPGLSLPEPPRSGFRIIAPPRPMMPGEEIRTCVSWPYPAIKNKTIYAGRVYATPGLHHSNVIAKPVNAAVGQNPYPGCHPGAEDPFGDLPAVIPDVLFASSTQVVGAETLAFPPGMGFVVDTSREISTSIHFLNASSEPVVVEVAYDFFTMPDAEREEELVPFVLNVNDFRIPPHATRNIGATCSTFGGNVVSFMPHTHRFAEAFDIDLLRGEAREARVYEDGPFDAESDIRVYDPSMPLDPGDSIRFACTFNNTSDHDLVFGLGDNEMCTLFGYMYPPEKQFVGYSPYQGEPCRSFGIGVFR